MKKRIWFLIFILLNSIIIVSAEDSILKPDDRDLGMVGDGNGGAFILSQDSFGKFSGTYVNPTYFKRVNYIGVSDVGPDTVAGPEVVIVNTDSINQYSIIVNGKDIGKIDIDPAYFFTLSDYSPISDGKGGAILSPRLKKDPTKIFVQFILADGSVFPPSPLLVSSVSDNFYWKFFPDGTGGAFLYSNEQLKHNFIFVKSDGTIFPGVNTPAILNFPVDGSITDVNRMSYDGKGNAVYYDLNIRVIDAKSDENFFDLHFYDGKTNIKVQIATFLDSSVDVVDTGQGFISDGNGGFIAYWGININNDPSSRVSAVFVNANRDISQPITLAAPKFSEIFNHNLVPDGLGGGILVFFEKTATGEQTSIQFLHPDRTISGLFVVFQGRVKKVVADGRGGAIILYQEGTEYKVKFISSKGEVSYVRTFIRGDSNNDKKVDLSDAIFTLSYLFQGGSEPACLDATDTNDDGIVDIADPIKTLFVLFQGSSMPQPYPSAGYDLTQDNIICDKL